MKKVLLVLSTCLFIQATCMFSGILNAQVSSPDTLSWSWEVSSTVSTHTKSLTIAFTDNLFVNWGDGITEWIPDSMSSKVITHYYEAQSNYLCTAIGVGISYFKADSRRLLSLETNKAPNLTYISCTSSQLTNLDLSKNSALVSLYIGSNDITALDLSENLLLQTLTCSDNKLTSLDISMLTSLKKATVHTNPITEIKVNPNGALTYLSCYNCNLSANSLDSIFYDLPTLSEISTSKNLYVLNNPGSSSCHSEIAALKKWTLDRVITQSSFYIPSVNCRMNDNIKVSVNLKNIVPAIAFELDILLPDGFVLDTLQTRLEAGRIGQHVLSISKISQISNTYKFIAYSNRSKDVFSGGDGAILNIYLETPSAMSSYTLDIKNAILVDTLTNALDISVTDGNITVNAAALMGDANGDTNVNVTDIVFLVAWINGKNPSGFFSDAADMDGNGSLNVVDITKLVETINSLSGSPASSPKRLNISGRTPEFYNSGNTATGNHMYLQQSVENPVSLELYLVNNDYLQAFQVDILLPENIGFNKSLLNKTIRSNNHVFSLEQISYVENRWRLIAYSLRNNELFPEKNGSVAVLNLECDESISDGKFNVFLENPVFTGLNMKGADVNLYDSELTFKPQLAFSGDFEIVTTKGLMSIYCKKPYSIIVQDILGRKVTEYFTNGKTLNHFSMKSGLYVVNVYSTEGLAGVRKVLVN